MTCSGSYYKEGSNCSLTCLSGKYGDINDHTCKSCSWGNCATCKTPDDPAYCLSCSGSYYLEGTTCVDIFAAGKYKYSNNNTCFNTCLSCPNNCYACS